LSSLNPLDFGSAIIRDLDIRDLDIRDLDIRDSDSRD
jgi:hypothetical protein